MDVSESSLRDGDPDAPARAASRPSIGIALSGGGHRATLFSLGALLYLAHARQRDGTRPSNDVKLISSVSGGSITNAFLGQTLDFPAALPEEFTAAAARLASEIARRGTLFAAWQTWALLLALLLCLSAPAVAIKAAIGGAATTSHIAAAVVGILTAGAVLQARGVVFELALRKRLLSHPSGRATTLADMDHRPSPADEEHPVIRLRGDDRDFRHVLCGTEIQTGQPIYFSRSGIDCAPFNVSLGADTVTLAGAVQASAALPVAFPPRSFKAKLGRWAGWRGREPNRVVVVDGGVRDNLAVELFVAQHGIPPPPWRPPITRLIVIGGAANRLQQGHVRRSLPYVGELASLWRVANFPYDTRERVQRRALEARFRHTDPTGAVVHIEESPTELAAAIVAWGENWVWQGIPPGARESSHSVRQFYATRVHGVTGIEMSPSNVWAGDLFWHHTDRALGILRVLGRAEGLELGKVFSRREDIAAGRSVQSEAFKSLVGAWSRRTADNAGIPTRLNRLGIDVSARLMWHGFALTMARMHLFWGYPLLDVKPKFFEDLAVGLARSVDTRPKPAADVEEEGDP